MMNNCLFCSLVSEPETHVKPEDEILDQTNNLYAKPELGSFIEGYTLIISKSHHLSFAHLPRSQFHEYQEFKELLASRIGKLYSSPVIMFEHGDVNPLTSTGCCIHHAHLHILPFNEDVHEVLLARFSHEIIPEIGRLESYKTNKMSYIYYETAARQKFVFKLGASVEGQYLRRVICQRMGIPDQWDWAAYPFIEKINEYKEKYSTAYRSEAHQSQPREK